MVQQTPWWESKPVQAAARGIDSFVEASKKVPVFGGIIRGLDDGGQAVNSGDWSGAARNYGSAIGNLALAGLTGASAGLLGRGAIAGGRAFAGGAGARAAGVAAGQAGRGALSSGIGGRRSTAIGIGGGILSSLAPRTSGPTVPSLLTSTPESSMSSWERALATGQGGGSLGDQMRQNMAGATTPASPDGPAAAPQAPSFSQALRGLTTGQQEYFESLVSGEEAGMRRRLSDIERQEQQARLETGQRVRRAGALGAGSAADLRAAAASRGLLSSPAAYETGREYLSGQTALEQASARGSLDRMLSQGAEARAGERERFEQFMQNVRRERLSQQQENEREFMNRLLAAQNMYFG